MRHCIQIGGVALAFVVLFGLQAGAQEKKKLRPEGAPQLGQPPESGPVPKPFVRPEPGEPKRDPTEPSPKLRDVLDSPKLIGPGAPPPLPPIVLRGRIVGENQPAGVLLELDAKSHPVAANVGSEFGIGGLRIKVVAINVNEVRIEVGGRNEIIVLR